MVRIGVDSGRAIVTGTIMVSLDLVNSTLSNDEKYTIDQVVSLSLPIKGLLVNISTKACSGTKKYSMAVARYIYGYLCLHRRHN